MDLSTGMGDEKTDAINVVVVVIECVCDKGYGMTEGEEHPAAM